jgi:hypothetical protein
MACAAEHYSERAFSLGGTRLELLHADGGRVFGDAAATDTERMAATLARWIIRGGFRTRFACGSVTRKRLPGLRTAEQIKRPPTPVEADCRAHHAGFRQGRPPVVYPVNPL